MQRLSPGTISLIFLVTAGALFFVGQADSKFQVLSEPKEYAMYAAKYALDGCIAFGALYFYIPSKTNADVMGTAWANGLLMVGKDILGRAEIARDALGTLASIGCTSPNQLPVKYTTEFSDVASYCAGWRARERRGYWSKDLSILLEKSTVALFDFLITLEISKSPAPQILNEKRDAALACLDSVIAELRRVLMMPNG